jgi:hypothetical protein
MEQTVAMSTDGQHELALPGYRDEDVITFDEGLVGFPASKRFVVMENEALSPFAFCNASISATLAFWSSIPGSLSRTTTVRFLKTPGKQLASRTHRTAWLSQFRSSGRIPRRAPPICKRRFSSTIKK